MWWVKQLVKLCKFDTIFNQFSFVVLFGELGAVGQVIGIQVPISYSIPSVAVIGFFYFDIWVSTKITLCRVNIKKETVQAYIFAASVVQLFSVLMRSSFVHTSRTLTKMSKDWFPLLIHYWTWAYPIYSTFCTISRRFLDYLYHAGRVGNVFYFQFFLHLQWFCLLNISFMTSWQLTVVIFVF